MGEAGDARFCIRSKLGGLPNDSRAPSTGKQFNGRRICPSESHAEALRRPFRRADSRTELAACMPP